MNHCPLFEQQIWRKDKCKHCFKTEIQHVSTISHTSSSSSLKGSGGMLNNSNINSNNNNPVDKNNTNNSNNNSTPKKNSSSFYQSPNTSPSVDKLNKAPLSIRRSLTPLAIETFNRQISTNSIPAVVTSNTTTTTTTPEPDSTSSTMVTNHRPLPKPPTPGSSPNKSLLFNKIKVPPPPPSPTKSTNSSPDTIVSDSSPIAMSPLNISSPPANVDSTSSTPIEISPTGTPSFTSRQSRSHSDSPEKPSHGDKTNKSHSFLKPTSGSSSPIPIYQKKHVRNLSANSSQKPSVFSSSPNFQNSIFQQQLQQPPLSPSPILTSSNSSNQSTPSSPSPVLTSSSSSTHSNINIPNIHALKASSGGGSLNHNIGVSGRKYSIAKSFIKMKSKNANLSSSPLSSSSGIPNSNNKKNGNSGTSKVNSEEQNKLMLMIQSVISALPGISKSTVFAVMDTLNNQNLDINYHTLVGSQQLENLTKASQTLQTWIEAQDNVRDVIIVQSCIRRFLSKRRTEWLTDVYCKSILKDRNIAFRQLIQLERRYNENLDIIITHYYKPIKLSNFLYDTDFKSIFSSIEEISIVHQKILLQFEQLHSKWPCVEGLGDIFLRIAPDLKVYGNYVKNFKNAIDTLNRCQDENPKFAAFLVECCENTPGKLFDLMALIATPLNHLSIYERQIFSIANSTPSNWPDYVNIINAVTMMKEVEQLVQDNLAQAQNAANLMNIYRKINNKKAIDPFVIPGRTYIDEGKLLKFELKKQDQSYYYFLCNDIILFVKKQKDLFKFKSIFYLNDVIVSDLPDSSSYKNIISIVNNKTKETYSFSLEDVKIKKELIRRLSSLCTINFNKSTKIFGVSLLELIQKENSQSPVPSIVIYIYLECEGLFRISPNQFDVDTLKENLNKEQNQTNLESLISKSGPHLLAALLKSFFRDLVPPLLTFELFDKIIEIGDLSSTNEQISQLKTLLQTIPVLHQNTLQTILLLLLTVGQYSEKNKMTHSNLAIVFGPNLIKPLHQTIETSLKIPVINNVITTMLDHYQLLYKGEHIDCPILISMMTKEHDPSENQIPLVDSKYPARSALKSQLAVSNQWMKVSIPIQAFGNFNYSGIQIKISPNYQQDAIIYFDDIGVVNTPSEYEVESYQQNDNGLPPKFRSSRNMQVLTTQPPESMENECTRIMEHRNGYFENLLLPARPFFASEGEEHSFFSNDTDYFNGGKKFVFLKDMGRIKFYNNGDILIEGPLISKDDPSKSNAWWANIMMHPTDTPDPIHIKRELPESFYSEQGGPVDPKFWSFFQPSSSYAYLDGLGANKGKRLPITGVDMNMPLMMGEGANGKNTNIGMSVWFTFAPPLNSTRRIVMDMNVDLVSLPVTPQNVYPAQVCHNNSIAMGVQVFLDKNQDGRKQIYEFGVPDVKITLLTEYNMVAKDVQGKHVDTITTNVHGLIHFDKLPYGRYYLFYYYDYPRKIIPSSKFDWQNPKKTGIIDLTMDNPSVIRTDHTIFPVHSCYIVPSYKLNLMV
eukprot:gene5591-6959_t